MFTECSLDLILHEKRLRLIAVVLEHQEYWVRVNFESVMLDEQKTFLKFKFRRLQRPIHNDGLPFIPIPTVEFETSHTLIYSKING